jgi:glycosyltransferase involved in cell wall biosynthesis
MNVPVARYLDDQQILRPDQSPARPLVSVCMPTYRLRPNGTNQRAIESVLAQSFTDFEFIIVDDGSLDGLHSMLLDYQQQDPRIVIIRHDLNSGLPAVRLNEALMIARGKYIAYMFEDDEWLPQALEKLLGVAQQTTEDCLVYGAVKWAIHRPNGQVDHLMLGDWDFNYGALKNSNHIANCAVLHPRSVFDTCGLYDPHILLRRACDYDLWLRMARVIPFRRCAEIIGQVPSGTAHSIGLTVDQDLMVTYRYLNTERDADLLPAVIDQYKVDSLDFIKQPSEKHRIQERYIIPFWQQHPTILTPGERKAALISTANPAHCLVTKSDYSTSVDVTLGNFSHLFSGFELSFSFLAERNLLGLSKWHHDILVLYRTVGNNSLLEMQKARTHNKPVAYFMDDNMFKFGSGYLAEEFSFLKPDTPTFQILEREVSEADLVVCYSEMIAHDCLKYNPRVIELSTNIQEGYILNTEPMAKDTSEGRLIKYAILTGSARNRELGMLWKVFQEFAERHVNEIEFHVWGVDPLDFGELPCRTYHKEFNHSYDAYLHALADEKFDYVLCPLFDDHDTKISKSPIKFLEATAAGAVGIYSDVVVYQAVRHGVSGLKVVNDPEAWNDILELSFAQTTAERLEIFEAAKNEILKNFTSESQVLKHLSAFEAVQLHNSLLSRTAQNGHAAIAYFFHESLLGGATLHLMQHALILQHYGFQPVFCFAKGMNVDQQVQIFAQKHDIQIVQLDFIFSVSPRNPSLEDSFRVQKLKEWLESADIRFVHVVTYILDVALAASDLGIPSLATLHAYYDPPPAFIMDSSMRPFSAVHSSSLRYAEKWQSVLNIPAFCIRAPIKDKYFDNFTDRYAAQQAGVPTLLVSGTLQPRKAQLKAIQAVGKLKALGLNIKLILLGYDDLLPDYVNECQQMIRELSLEEHVKIQGYAEDPQSFYDQSDYVLCSSDVESMPQSILKGMACGARIITTPVGGVKELVVDGFSGIVAHGFEVDDLAEAIHRALCIPSSHWTVMTENAHAAARMSCSEELVAYKLLGLYNLAARETAGLTKLPQQEIIHLAESKSLPAAEIFSVDEPRYEYEQGEPVNLVNAKFSSHNEFYLEFVCLRDNLSGFAFVNPRLSDRDELCVKIEGAHGRLLRKGALNKSEVSLGLRCMLATIVNTKNVSLTITIFSSTDVVKSFRDDRHALVIPLYLKDA